MRRVCFRGIVGAFILGTMPLLAPLPCRAGSIAATTFSDGLDSWTAVDVTASGNNTTQTGVSYVSSGGNPGGYASFNDAASAGGTTYLVAPSSFLGNYEQKGLDGFGSISFDHIITASGKGDTFDNYEIILSGPGSNPVTATWIGTMPVLTNTGTTQNPDFTTPWVTETAPLIQSMWTVTGGTWVGLLENVASLEIRVELVDNNHSGVSSTDTEGIDNIVLSTTVPEPRSLIMAVAGFSFVGFMTWRRRRTCRLGDVT